MLSNNSVCSALGTKPKVILSKVGAVVVAGESSDSSTTSAASSPIFLSILLYHLRKFY